MNDDARRLALARGAWLGSLPDDAETARAARRIERRLGAEVVRSSNRTVWWVVAVSLVGTGVALAYGLVRDGAKAPGPPALSGQTSRAEPRGLEHRAPVASRALPPPAEAPLEPSQPSARASRARGGERGAMATQPAPADSASWKAVDEALDARDETRARAALDELAQHADPAVSAKAELGLAQLLLSQGDCPGAARRVHRLEQIEGAPAHLVARGRRLLRDCR